MNREKESLIEFFLNPQNYPEKVDSIKHIETHISHVFIAGNYVYKIKKPVNFGFLDFTTLQKEDFIAIEKLNSIQDYQKTFIKVFFPYLVPKRGYH